MLAVDEQHRGLAEAVSNNVRNAAVTHLLEPEHTLREGLLGEHVARHLAPPEQREQREPSGGLQVTMRQRPQYFLYDVDRSVHHFAPFSDCFLFLFATTLVNSRVDAAAA